MMMVLNFVQKSICILLVFVTLNVLGQEKPIKTIHTKQLRFLYFSNGGMIGYFDDGTLVGCPKCDFCKTNIESMFSLKVMGNYEILKNGILLVDGSKKILPNQKKDKGWVLINYHWFEKIPQF